MSWTERDQQKWQEFKEWEKNLNSYEVTDIERTYDKWIERGFQKLPTEVREKFFNKIDTWLFHLHALIQGTEVQQDLTTRILNEGRIFKNKVSSITEMSFLTIDQLTYIADQQIARQRLISCAQGGITGTGGMLFLGVDFPLMAALNLRAIQLIALTYGNDVKTPYEMMLSLKVFHAATMPKRFYSSAFKQLKGELSSYNTIQDYLYVGDESLTDESWMEQPLKQLLKSLGIIVLKRKLIQGIPLLSIALGAGMNYYLTRDVTNFAHKFYQYRYLNEKQGLE